MKKKRFFIAAIIVLLLLIVPIPTGVYKDGGTRTYTALTYKIVSWKHLYGTTEEEHGLYQAVRVYPFPQNFKSLDALWDVEEQKIQEKQGNRDSQDAGKNGQEIPVVTACKFDAQYIRTNGYQEGMKYPVVKVIRSVEELNAYYNANKDHYNLERNDKVEMYEDETIGFLNACEKYDEAYFKEQVLIMVLLEEPSGSIRHEVQGVSLTEEDVGEDGLKQTKMMIQIERLVPALGTDDMAMWHILIEPEKGVVIEGEPEVTITCP